MSLEPLKEKLQQYLASLPDETDRPVIFLHANQVNIGCADVRYTNPAESREKDANGERHEPRVNTP